MYKNAFDANKGIPIIVSMYVVKCMHRDENQDLRVHHELL